VCAGVRVKKMDSARKMIFSAPPCLIHVSTPAHL
jgi:hypothetical protein